jgi:hypothetical protein
VPRYLFTHQRQLLADAEGTECSGMAEVRAQAIQTAGTILRDMNGTLSSELEWQMHVTDESQTTVFTLRFSAEEPADASEAWL